MVPSGRLLVEKPQLPLSGSSSTERPVMDVEEMPVTHGQCSWKECVALKSRLLSGKGSVPGIYT